MGNPPSAAVIPQAAQEAAIYKKLKEIRDRKDLKLKANKYLKETFTDFNGKERPLKVRYYQIQGMFHLVLMKRFLLGDDCGLGKCKPYDSLILTDRGLLRLGDLAPEGILKPDTFYPPRFPVQVWTGWNWAPVRRFYYSGIKPTKTVKTRRGYQTTGSWVHPLWVRNGLGEGFSAMQTLTGTSNYACLFNSLVPFPIQEPSLPVPARDQFNVHTKFYKVPDQLNPSLASLLGYVVAEGWTNGVYATSITQQKDLSPETHVHIRTLCQEVFGWEGNQGAKNRDTTISIDSVYLRSYLDGLGIKVGLSSVKCVPWPVFQGTQVSVAAFLRAFFDGEGSVTGDVLEVSSASEQLLREVQILLLRFGIMCSRSPKKVLGRDHIYWKLAICGDDARQFYKTIGFLTPRKQEALEKFLGKTSNVNLDVIPHVSSAIETLRNHILTCTSRKGANSRRKGSGLKQFGVPFVNALNGIRNGGRNLTYAFLDRLLKIACMVGAQDTDAYRQLESIYRNGFFYDPIVKIEDGEQELADIEVDDPRHSFVADGFINHNTLEVIIALCCIWDQDPNRKAVVFATKSATKQWANEFSKFTSGVRVITCMGTPIQRANARELFLRSTGPTVMVMGYRSAVQDFTHIQDWKGIILVTDEAVAYKNPKTQVHQVCRHLSSQADRVWALTATMIKNHLMEGFGVYQVIKPDVFKMQGKIMNYNQFMIYYCITQMQRLPRSNRMVPVIMGYSPEKIKEFREVIDPYYIGRPKHEVATELPSLSTRVIEVEMTQAQEDKYAEALTGLLALGNTEDAVVKETTKLTQISYCQEIANHPMLINCEGDSGKLEMLIELLTEGDFEDEKVIIFSRFSKMVDLIMARLEKEKIGAARVTGAENQLQRDAAMKAFQNPDSDTRVICITTAGSESINLQAAKALVCFDTPWSGGDFLQLVGRMIRIGSVHDRCYVIHLIAKGKRRKTVDHRVMEKLGQKMTLIEAVLGKRLKGDGDVLGVIAVENDIADLFAALRQDALDAKQED